MNKNLYQSLFIIQPIIIHYKFSRIKKNITFIISILFLLLLIYAYKEISNKEDFRRGYNEYIIGGNKIILVYNFFLILFYTYYSLEFFKKKVSLFKFLIISFILVFLQFLTGSRSNLALYGLIPLLIGYYKKIINNKALLIIFCFGIIIFISTRIFTILNSSYLNYYTINNMIVEENLRETFLNFLTTQINDIGYRTHKILNDVPQKFPRLYGKSLFFEFYSLLPGRQINPAIDLNHRLFHSSTDDIQIPPTLVAEFYLDFGIIGIIIGGVAIGSIYTLIHLKFKLNPSFINFFNYLIFSYFLFLSIYGRFQIFFIIWFMIFNLLFYKITIKKIK